MVILLDVSALVEAGLLMRCQHRPRKSTCIMKTTAIGSSQLYLLYFLQPKRFSERRSCSCPTLSRFRRRDTSGPRFLDLQQDCRDKCFKLDPELCMWIAWRRRSCPGNPEEDTKLQTCGSGRENQVRKTSNPNVSRGRSFPFIENIAQPVTSDTRRFGRHRWWELSSHLHYDMDLSCTWQLPGAILTFRVGCILRRIWALYHCSSTPNAEFSQRADTVKGQTQSSLAAMQPVSDHCTPT